MKVSNFNELNFLKRNARGESLKALRETFVGDNEYFRKS